MPSAGRSLWSMRPHWSLGLKPEKDLQCIKDLERGGFDIMKRELKKELFVGVDLHKKKFNSTFYCEGKKSEYLIFDFTDKGLSDFIEMLEAFRKRDYSVKVALEMLTGSYYFYDAVSEHCDEIIILDANKFKIIASSTKKTDKIDSETIALYHSKALLPTVYVPNRSVRHLRETVAFRNKLVKERSSHKNQIHSLLLKVGTTIPKRCLSTRKQLEALKELKLSDIFYEKRLKMLVEQIERLNETIKETESLMEEITESEGNEDLKKAVEILQSIPGIGYLSARILISAIATIDRFETEKQLASYIGIVPSVRNSGGEIKHGRITKKGNRIARTILVQNALSLLKCKNGPLKGFYNGVKSRGGTGKAIIALARKTLTIAFYLLKKGEYFDGSYYKKAA